jgi:SOS-response transcriptional repressor LexA
MSQCELARRAFVSRSYISHLETGRNVASYEVLGHIADALGVTRSDLDPDNETPEPDDPERALGMEVMRVINGVPIQDWGRVPADAPRWVESQRKGATVDVPRAWVGSRKPNQLFVVEASGDCLMRFGIVTGSKVLCELANGREPRNGEIAAVRIGGERSLKRWYRDGSNITLTDGDDHIVARLTTDDDIEVVGLFIGAWKLRDEQ